MAYQVGDSPAEPMRITAYSVDLAEYDSVVATAAVPTPDGVQLLVLDADIEGDEILVHFELYGSGEPLKLEEPGLWIVQATLMNAASSRQRALPPIRFVVDDNATGWHTVTSARESDWPDAREMTDMTMHELLETSKRDVLAFAPALDEGDPIPASYRMAQLAHARNRWNAALADPSTGDIGGEGFAIPARPLDWQIKQLLRPSSGIPAAF